MAPSARRSNASIVRATRQPSWSSPSTLATGTRTSSRKTSLKCESPVIWRNGRTVMPGTCMSTINMEMPSRLGRAGSLRTRQAA